MQHVETAQGLTYSTSVPEAAEQFDKVVTAYLGFDRDTGTELKSTFALDPDMPMALCAGGYFQKLFGCASMSAKAVESNAKLARRIEGANITDRERLHAAALSAWCDGDLDTTVRRWEEILVDHPTDALALRLAHFLHFYSGDGRRMRDSVARVIPHWSKENPNYGFMLGMYAFGHEESADYAAAEKLGREAVAINPTDAWSVHAVAHVLEMCERHEEGIAWVNGLEESWSKVNNFRFHLYWHRALYHLERGEFDVVLDLYDREVSSDIESDFYLDICNAASLLWRMELYGVDVGNRWQALGEVSRRHTDDEDLIFVTLHYLMALVSAGDAEASEKMIATVRNWAAKDNTQGRECARSGLQVAEAIREIRSGDFVSAAARLRNVRYVMDGLGGSKAQRDVFEQLMLDSADQSGNAKLARTLFAERTARRPKSAWGWKRYAGNLEACGQPDRAAEAKQAAAALTG